MGKAVVGFLAILVALGGLAVAANSGVGVTYHIGLAVTVLGILVTFGAIKLHYDEVEKTLPHGPESSTAQKADSTPESGDSPSEDSTSDSFVGIPASAHLPASYTSDREPFLDTAARRWLKGAGVGLLGLYGLFLAAGASGGFAYYGGLALTLLCVLGIFRMIGAATGDAADSDAPLMPVPDSGIKCWFAGVASGLIALVALFQAAASVNGPGYYIGMMVAVAALFYIFHLMKVGYDRLEQHN
ncbi:hypothetical protein [Fodinicurvata sediminis]|uniref:hypothetical protein n=1 Tax=Fodinicurvata sediminis TaxID=1121832 RepID=UPI0003B4C22D|nr:hypothetical protein [Fodinicurvata sediminis]